MLMIAGEFLSKRGEKFLAQASGAAKGEPERALGYTYKAADIYAEAIFREKSPTLKEKYLKKFREAERMSIDIACDLIKNGNRSLDSPRKIDASISKPSKYTKKNQMDDTEYDTDWIEEECLVRTNTNFDDVVGLDYVKRKLELNLVRPMRDGKVFPGLGRSKGLIMYGPPGCGKTYIASTAANEIGSNAKFLSMDVSSILSKWYGESSKKVRDVFNYAKGYSPSIVFVDELDALSSEKGVEESVATRRVNATLLTEIDGVRKEKRGDVYVIGGTNRPWDLTPPLKSRLRPMIYISPPNKKSKEKILKKEVGRLFDGDNILEGVSVNVDFGRVSDYMEKDKRGVYSGRDMETIVQDAFELASNDYYNNGGEKRVETGHFLDTVRTIGPGISYQELRRYEDFAGVSHERTAVRE